jgi:hypothetical protein
VEPGKVFEVRPFPFMRHVACLPGEDGYEDTPCWKPGTAFESTQRYLGHGEYAEDVYCVAHGEGALRLHVVSVHKPGRYPTRVFYRREWVDPDGKVFGRPGLKVCVLSQFRRLATGYAHEYVVHDKQADQSKAGAA